MLEYLSRHLPFLVWTIMFCAMFWAGVIYWIIQSDIVNTVAK